MFRFAHISDCHLGFQKQEKLQKIEQEIFEKSLDLCLEKKVNFILISGDLFHTSLPEMRVQRYAFRKFKELYEKNVPIYVVYGSHDYSPVSHSVIDLLTDVGYLIKTTRVKDSEGDKINLDFINEPSTGAKIVGLPGRTAGLEKKYYEILDHDSLESEKGFKIFLFHGGIDELKDKATPEIDSMPLSLLPRSFDYYAGGHVHTKLIENEYEGYGTIAYPGTLFAGHHGDLETSAKGTQRGFLLVEFDEKLNNVEFVPIQSVEYELIDIKVDGMSSSKAKKEIEKHTQNIEPKDKIVYIKVRGELSSGKTSEVDFGKIAENLRNQGAIDVKIHQRQFSSREYNITVARGETKEEKIQNIFKENISEVKLNQPELLGDKGISLAQKLLHKLKQPKYLDETTADYQRRIEDDAINLLGLKTKNDT